MDRHACGHHSRPSRRWVTSFEHRRGAARTCRTTGAEYGGHGGGGHRRAIRAVHRVYALRRGFPVCVAGGDSALNHGHRCGTPICHQLGFFGRSRHFQADLYGRRSRRSGIHRAGTVCGADELREGRDGKPDHARGVCPDARTRHVRDTFSRCDRPVLHLVDCAVGHGHRRGHQR